MKIFKNRLLGIIFLVITAAVMRFFLLNFVEGEYSVLVKSITIAFILLVGALFVLKKIAEVIEETTEILSERTKVASGLLQSLGTAFPDMILGVTSAVISLSYVKTDYKMAINFAVIAAATTFGSNIYNIAYAAWCIFRQNLANSKKAAVPMFPGLNSLGKVTPMEQHKTKPSLWEVDQSANILNMLTVLTGFTAVAMVLFGRVTNISFLSGDVYRLIRPVGFILLLTCILVIYYFRKTKRRKILVKEIAAEERYYDKKTTILILLDLLLAGVAILFTAESMVVAIEELCSITGLPLVIAGVLSGFIGCMGEMIVVYNFTVNPRGRIGDALVGVAMDNIVTIMGAAVVAVMGGIFLGGNALILIFTITLCLNSILLWQISKLKNFFMKKYSYN